MKTIFEIKDGVLEHCQVNEPEVVIPEGVKVIASGAFKAPDSYKGQDALVSVVIPKTVEKIESEAFQYCKNLKKVTILGPAEIGNEVFVSCKNLTEVYLADGVRSIGGSCFSYCENLKELFIPESVTEIGREIAEMNDSSYKYPRFYCYRKGMGADWNPYWNLKYNDPRFYGDQNYYHYHTTLFGVTRDGKPREDREQILVTDMPHGTGKPYEEPENDGEGMHLPDTKLRLWLTATRTDLTGKKEYQLDEEERDMMPKLLRDPDQSNAPLRRLDEPWEVTVNDDTRYLAPELKIYAWINDFDDCFDGHTLMVHHDMPWHLDPYEEYPVSPLVEGGTVIAEMNFTQSNAVYDVRLHIQWPKQEKLSFALTEVFERLRQLQEQWAEYKDGDNEIDVSLGHYGKKAEFYKTYRPSDFPEQLISDLTTDSEVQEGLALILIQPYRFYEELHSFSDDYKDAAEAYGEDCDDWYSTERCQTGERVCLEVH